MTKQQKLDLFTLMAKSESDLEHKAKIIESGNYDETSENAYRFAQLKINTLNQTFEILEILEEYRNL